MCVYIPGSNEWMALVWAVKTLSALRQRAVQQQISVCQHCQYRLLGSLHTQTLNQIICFLHITIILNIKHTHTCSMIQPTCVMSMPGCRVLRLSLTVESSAAQLAWIAVYHDWAIAGSFALKNADSFLSADTTSKYLHT